jgi:hypothetical protein
MAQFSSAINLEEWGNGISANTIESGERVSLTLIPPLARGGKTTLLYSTEFFISLFF